MIYNKLLNHCKSEYSEFLDSISNMSISDQLGHQYYWLNNKLKDAYNDLGIDWTLEKKTLIEFLKSEKSRININDAYNMRNIS